MIQIRTRFYWAVFGMTAVCAWPCQAQVRPYQQPGYRPGVSGTFRSAGWPSGYYNYRTPHYWRAPARADGHQLRSADPGHHVAARLERRTGRASCSTPHSSHGST